MIDLEGIEVLFAQHGSAQYSGEPVTQIEHALQTAHLAEQSDASDELVTACLLHDLGHLLYFAAPRSLRPQPPGAAPGAIRRSPVEQGQTPTLRGIDDTHQCLALPFLRGLFADTVLDAIQLRVDAMRYLCQANPGYSVRLSDDSRRSLALQGGVFDAARAAAHLAQPGARDAVMLRQWDDLAKQADWPTPSLAHFMSRAARCAIAARA